MDPGGSGDGAWSFPTAAFPTMTFAASNRPKHECNIPDNWAHLTEPVDWKRVIGPSGAELVSQICTTTKGGKVYDVTTNRYRCRTIPNRRVRDEIDIVVHGGRKMSGLAQKLWESSMRAYAVDYHMLQKFVPKLAQKLRCGAVMFAKEDFCHIRCMSEVFKLTRGKQDLGAAVVDGMLALLGTGTLQPRQTLQFANFLLKYGFPLKLYSAIVVPAEHVVKDFYHVCKKKSVPGFAAASKEIHFEYADLVETFVSALLFQGEEKLAIQLLLRSGNPTVALHVRDKLDKDELWYETLRDTYEWMKNRVGDSVRATVNRLYHMKNVGRTHPRTGLVIATYAVPCPLGCVSFGTQLRLPPVPHMVLHTKTAHHNVSHILCDHCRSPLPSETDGIGPLWRERSYLAHMIYCTELRPIYSTPYLIQKSLRSVKDGPNFFEKLVGYPGLPDTDEFPDLNVEYLVIGSGPSTVVMGCTLAVRMHSDSQIEHYANVIANVWDSDPDYRPILGSLVEDSDLEYATPHEYETSVEEPTWEP